MLLAVVLVVAGLLGAALTVTPAVDSAGSPPPDRLVAPDGTSSYVWPYTGRIRSVEGRTLALNVVVRGDAERVRRALVDRSDANWSAVDPNGTVEVSPW